MKNVSIFLSVHYIMYVFITLNETVLKFYCRCVNK